MSELPSGWIMVSIGDILASQADGKLIHQGWSPRCHTYPAADGNWGVLKTTAIQDGLFLDHHNKELPDDKDPKPRVEVNAGDLLLTNAGPRIRCGIVALVKDVREKLMLSGKMYRLRFYESCVSPNYIESYLRSSNAQREIDKRKTGMSESGLNLTQERFLSLPVVLCPLNEQARIANKLDSLLAKVEETQARLEKIPSILKRFRQSVLAAATSGELTKEWREDRISDLDNALADQEITEYDGSELNELPDSWCYVPFNVAAEIKSNLVDPKLTPEAIHLAPNHIESNSGRVLGLVTVAQDDVKSGKHKFYAGQIVYSKIRPYLNKVCLVDFEGLCSADMYPITANLETKYLLYCMLSTEFVDFTSRQQGRVVLPKINQKALNAIPVPVASGEEQKEIVRRVESLFALANKVEKQYLAAKQHTDRLTQSLLAKAFRGELVPQDPNDEPASELLKRIQAVRESLDKNKPKRKAKKKA